MENLRFQKNSNESNNKNNKHSNQKANNRDKSSSIKNNEKSNSNTSASASASMNNYLDSFIDDNIEPCQFQTIKPNAKYNFTVTCDCEGKILIYSPTKNNICPIIINYELLDKDFQRTLFIQLVELIDKPSKFINAWQTISDLINNFTNNYAFNKHEMNKNKGNPTFIYQKQDLLNIIIQIVS
jgi:hypothetical protein